MLPLGKASQFPAALWPSWKQALLALKQYSRGSSVPLGWKAQVELRPLTPWGKPLQLGLPSHLWVAGPRVWILTILCLCPSQIPCGSFFLSLIMKKKSFLLVFKFYSEIVFFCVSSCDFGAPVGEVEFRVFLLHPLVSLCFLFVCIFVLFFCYSSLNELRWKLRQKVGILL